MCGFGGNESDGTEETVSLTQAQQRASLKAQIKNIASHVASTVKRSARETKVLEKQLAALSK